MAATAEVKPATVQEKQLPDWEHATGRPVGADPNRSSIIHQFSAKLDRVFPPHRRYLRLSRNVFGAVLLATVAALALILGLALGLTRRSHDQDLPLPSNAKTFTGDLTYFEPGLGACGETDTSSDKIVSVSHLLFDSAGSSTAAGGNSNLNPLCNLMLRAQRFDEQYNAMRSVDLKVVDRCTGCAETDLDTTESAFEVLAPLASGRVDVTWAWLQPVATGT